MVKVCEVFGCTTTEKDGLCMHKFPKKNVEHRNAWVAWITRNRPGWSLKCNSRVCELHFVAEDYVEDTRRNGILRRLKTSAIPSLQVEGIKNSENHCNTKTIRIRFRQTAQYLKDQIQDCLEVGNTHKGEKLQLSVRCLKDEHSDVTHAMKTIDNEYTSCSTPPTKHPLLTSRLTASSTLLQEDMTVSVAQKDSDNDCNIQTLFDGETTEHQLTLIILATKALEFKPLPGFDPNVDSSQYYRAQQEIDCDEVYPGIYIGDGITAKNKKYLEMLGITHLLNTAEGKRFGFVNTDKIYYADTTIKYLGLPIKDLPTEDISKYFYTAANFINDAISTRGKAFVHCMQGVSRSATCVLAYLMIKIDMLAVDAMHLIRTNRDVRPNKGFLWQLAQLDNKLRRQRLTSLTPLK
ncbi:uncharacterized protein LOC143908674 isoform X3 [Temnothorax americanus]|uniref:uncharacterized protein LOC143908674 isoform X3 n=1 Tax=Temnothorax americanus TaxID=1964332 RepID=UPI0040688DCB